MTKSYVYRYLTKDGGMLETSVELAGVEGIRLVRLAASANKILTDGKLVCPSIVVPENTVDRWYEVANKG